jgi:hypothetical protein
MGTAHLGDVGVNLLRTLAGLAGVLLIVAGPLPVAFGVATMAGGIRRRSPLGHSILVVLVVWSALESFVGVLLGTAGRLDLGSAAAAHAFLFAAGLILPREWKVLASVRRKRPLREWTVLALVAVVSCHLGWSVATTAINDFDSLAYHLPAMATWYQTGALVAPERFSHRLVSGYPFGWELTCAMMVLPFGDDFLVALPNLAAWVMFGLATLLTALEVGAHRSAAWGAALLLLVTPMVLQHVTTMHVDLALAAFFAAAVYFALASRGHALGDIGLCLVAMGLVAASKTSGLVYDGFVCLTIAALALSHRTVNACIPASQPHEGTLLLAGAVIAMVVAGIWYARNWMTLGNPLGVVAVRVAGHTLFAGQIDPDFLRRTTIAHVFDPTSFGDWRIVAGALWHELGMPFATLCIVLIVPAPRGPLPRSESANQWFLVLAMLLLLVLTAVAYMTSPFGGDDGRNGWHVSQWTGQAFRYGFPFLGLLAVAAALRVTRRGWNENAIAMGAVLIALMGHGGRAIAAGLPIVAVVGLVAFGMCAMGRCMRGWRRWVGATALGALLVLGISELRGIRERDRCAKYGSVFRLATAAGAAGETIGDVSLQLMYPLFGERLLTRVASVPSRAGEGEAEWIARLHARGVRWVVFGPCVDRVGADREMAWVRRGGGPFTHILGSDAASEAVVYRLGTQPSPARSKE